MAKSKRADESRRAVWGYTFDEILEIIQLLLWANNQTSDGKQKNPCPATVDALFGERPIHRAVHHHMQQLLPIKIESIFGERGGGSSKDGQEMSANASLGKQFWGPMKAFAERSLENPQTIRMLLNKLEKDRHRLVAHREGKTANATHEKNGNLQSIIFKANPDDLTKAELEVLQKYFVACKFFCEHASYNDNKPELGQFEQSLWNHRS